jgi:hypothetical protein
VFLIESGRYFKQLNGLVAADSLMGFMIVFVDPVAYSLILTDTIIGRIQVNRLVFDRTMV